MKMANTDKELVIVRHSWGGMELTLNRPSKGNALNEALVERLHEALDEAVAARCRLVVLSGNGVHFCTGFDLTDVETSSDQELLHRFIRIELLLQKVSSAPLLTACYAHGRTFGAGADLMAACDQRVALMGTGFAFPGSGFGLLLGTGRLIARIGSEKARDVVRTGRMIETVEAAEMGLCKRVACSRSEQIEDWRRISDVIDLETETALRLFNNDDANRDLAMLVRSAARPGLRERILAYRDKRRAAQK